MNTDSKTKSEYFKKYYQKNKAKYKERNDKRPSLRQYFYTVEIDGVVYAFPSIKAMKISKQHKDAIESKQFKYVT